MSQSSCTQSWQARLWRLGLPLFAGLLAPFAAMADCPDLPLPELRVLALTPDSQLDVLDLREMDVASGPHPFIAIETVVGARVAIDATIISRDASYCPAPRQVLIGLGLSSRLVRLPAAAFRDECVKAELIAHAARHLAAEDHTVGVFVADSYAELGRALGFVRAKPAPSAEAAQKGFDSGAQNLVADARNRLDVAVRQASSAIDSEDALATLRQACGGRVQRMGRSSERRS